jgi:hypothetical protein
MKKIDQQDMQVKTVHKMQRALDNSIKTTRFFWRHACVLVMLGMMVNVVSLQAANWRNILISLAIAGLVDFFKMKIKIKLSSQKHSHNEIASKTFESYKKYIAWSTNPGIMGSPAYNLANMKTTKPNNDSHFC